MGKCQRRGVAIGSNMRHWVGKEEFSVFDFYKVKAE